MLILTFSEPVTNFFLLHYIHTSFTRKQTGTYNIVLYSLRRRGRAVLCKR